MFKCQFYHIFDSYVYIPTFPSIHGCGGHLLCGFWNIKQLKQF